MHASEITSPASSGDSRWWLDRRAAPLAAVGVALVASGLAHMAVWAVLGGPWEGPVTWRKPILFGISGGLTCLSLGWIWSHLPVRRGDGWLAAATAVALLVEVALIDLQQWRGVASHFNRGTSFDSGVYDAMGWLIGLVTLVACDLTVRMFLQRTTLPADMLLAARAGMLLLVASCLLGIWASVHGDIRQATGLSPETLGAAGVVKFPHGAVIHAVQWLPLVAWAARRLGIGESARVRMVAAVTAGTTLLGCYSLVQTLLGRARFDTTPLSATVLAAAAALMIVPLIAFLRRPDHTSDNLSAGQAD